MIATSFICLQMPINQLQQRAVSVWRMAATAKEVAEYVIRFDPSAALHIT